MEILFNAIEKNDIIKVKELIGDNVDLDVTDPFGYSALHIASSREMDKLAFLLVGNGINVNMQDKSGQTILHYVAVYGQFELAKSALNSGASLSIEDIHGNQPLWTAVFNDKGRNERFDMIKLFLEFGADVNHKNKVGKSPKDIVMIAGYNNLTPLIGSYDLKP